MRRRSTLIMAVITLGLGVALLVQSAVVGAAIASPRVLIGVLFTALGAARLYLLARAG